jgi:3-phosphoshikimate 1-carboxyvinyltransferase
MEKIIRKSAPLKGELFVAPDKSISHRAVIFSSLAKGEGIVRNFLQANDTLSTCDCMRQLGISIEEKDSILIICGKGLDGLKEPKTILDCGNSGTTIRLLSGLLASQPFFSVLSGDESLNARPMKRVIHPLSTMGADILARDDNSYPPLAIRGKLLKGIDYRLPVASAQLKSALILAALNAQDATILHEKEKSRDHTERMLAAMGADIESSELTIRIRPGIELMPQEFMVPGDISSAAFFLVAAAIVPGSELLIKNVGINPSRAGIIEVLKAMGAKIKVVNQRFFAGEEVADILVSSSELKAVELDGEIIPRLIDELPVLAVAMAVADGESSVRGAGELRVKETDRIAAVSSELARMGVQIKELDDGFIVQGNPDLLRGNPVNSHGDHRIAMSLAIAALRAEGETRIGGAEAVSISFPGFWSTLAQITETAP